jgi:hypothetical protein
MDIQRQCREAFQGDDVPVKNITLRKAHDEIERLRDENEWLKAQLPSSPEAAAAGGGFDPYNP